MKRLPILVFVLIVSSMLIFPQSVLTGEEPVWNAVETAASGDNSERWVIRKRVNEVAVFFTVMEGHKFIPDLLETEVTVRDNGRLPAKVSAFRHQSDVPLRLGLLVDASDSVYDRLVFEEEASSAFLRNVIRPLSDQAFVMSFAGDIILGQDYTDRLDKLAQGVSGLRSRPMTALFDAVSTACSKLSEFDDEVSAARVLVVLSDGNDNASKNTLKQALDAAERGQVTIYTITTNSGHARRGDRVLKHLAMQTGGRVFSSGTVRELAKSFSAIEEEMRSRYVLAYRPAEFHRDGRFHRIGISAMRGSTKFHVHARNGYYAR
jgi:VWFA-related protein